jgi:hypothetical protein
MTASIDGHFQKFIIPKTFQLVSERTTVKIEAGGSSLIDHGISPERQAMTGKK